MDNPAPAPSKDSPLSSSTADVPSLEKGKGDFIPPDMRLRGWVGWGAFVGGVIWGGVAGTAILISGWKQNLFAQIYKEHPPVAIGVPLAGLFSLVLVFVLQSTSGQIKFKLPGGFEFEGASGPILLWVLCYMTIISSVKLLW